MKRGSGGVSFHIYLCRIFKYVPFQIDSKCVTFEVETSIPKSDLNI